MRDKTMCGFVKGDGDNYRDYLNRGQIDRIGSHYYSHYDLDYKSHYDLDETISKKHECHYQWNADARDASR